MADVVAELTEHKEVLNGEVEDREGTDPVGETAKRKKKKKKKAKTAAAGEVAPAEFVANGG